MIKKNEDDLYKYNQEYFDEIIDHKQFEYKQLKYQKAKEDTTNVLGNYEFPDFSPGYYKGVVCIYDLKNNTLVARNVFSATNSEKVKKDKDSWTEMDEFQRAVLYSSSLESDLRFQTRKKLFKAIDDLSGH